VQIARTAIALHPTLFGRGRIRQTAAPLPPERALSADVKLFATTFIAGFVFVSILIG